MSDTLTLRELLSAQHARALLNQPSQRGSDAEAERADLAAALTLLGQRTFDADKLDLLRASFAPGLIQRDALRMTAMQAQGALAPPTRRTKAKTGTPEPGRELTVAGLDALPEGAWRECALWLAEQSGYTVEERPLLQRERLLAWKAHGAHGESAVVCATRLAPGAPLLDSDLRHLHAVTEHEQDIHLLAITTAEATVGARLLAREISAHLLDSIEMERLLASLATAHARERARSQENSKTQAKAATAARKKLVAALTAAEAQAKTTTGARLASGQPAVKKAVEQARDARRLAAQALLAWETLIAEWLATFGERPARDSALVFAAQPPVWIELGARADHLKKPLLDALRALAKTPRNGDLGYGPWRQAIGDELAARCSSLFWRASMIDPARWSDYAAAVNDQCAREASLADNAASHAAARAQRAQTDLAERAGPI